MPIGAKEECGAFFQMVRPRLNMSFPPLSWQTYDIEFTKAKFDAQGKTMIDMAMVTVWLNGQIIHDHQRLVNHTLLGDSVTTFDGPLRFQAHGDSVYFRNIWIVENNGSSIKRGPKKSPPSKNGFLEPGVGFRSRSTVNGRSVSENPSSGVYVPDNLGGMAEFYLRN
jgi:hypothetical protein